MTTTSPNDFHQKLLWVPLAISLFLLLDTFLFPTIHMEEMIVDIYETKAGRTVSFHLETDQTHYGVSESLFNAVNRGNVIRVYRSALTKAPIKVLVDHKEWRFFHNIGFVNTGFGLVCTGFILAVALGLYLLFHRLPNRNAQLRITYFMLILAFLLLFSYLDPDMF